MIRSAHDMFSLSGASAGSSTSMVPPSRASSGTTASTEPLRAVTVTSSPGRAPGGTGTATEVRLGRLGAGGSSALGRWVPGPKVCSMKASHQHEGYLYGAMSKGIKRLYIYRYKGHRAIGYRAIRDFIAFAAHLRWWEGQVGLVQQQIQLHLPLKPL